MKRNFLTYIFLCILLLGTVSSCKDDLLYGGGIIGEGESVISGTVKFKPLTPALNGTTRTAGNAIKSINSLCVLLYDEQGNLVKKYPLTPATGGTTTLNEGEYVLSEVERKNDKTESIGGKDKVLPPAESETPHADFKLIVPYGRYYIYAVANMGDLSDAPADSDLAAAIGETNLATAIRTVGGLKSISLQWNKDKVEANNQMFGFFSDASTDSDAPLLTINKGTTSLHAWIRRAVSKVTIAYDGSDLNENVFIYLKSVTIKDIPTECYLGKSSTINKDSVDDIDDYGGLIENGESITYVSGDMAYDEHWPARITRGKPYYYVNQENEGVSVSRAEYEKDKSQYAKLAHGEVNNALYFYENMQGEGKDKRQDKDENGVLDAPGLNDTPNAKFYKDQKPYGTYIEVKAYYSSNILGRVSNGDIIYRFMLGKNVTTDYNAERNHHYKLTLKFNKNANDVDWHISYEEPDPGLEVPNPYYISYLYNHSMMLPLKIRTGGTGVGIKQIEARILDNRWAPHNPNSDFDYYKAADKPYSEQWNGFLSLRETKDLNVTADNNQNYYEKHKRGEREYIPKDAELPKADEIKGYETTTDSVSDGKCFIRNEGDSVYHVQLPMYTRAKQLIKKTGYTGNNPYVAYQRRAEIKIVVTLTNDKKISTDGKDFEGNPVANAKDKDKDKDLKNPVIYQVRRIVNPKGVWRKSDNNSDFHVQLKRLPKENGTVFQTFSSEGPWKAYVYCGTEDFIGLSDGNEAKTAVDTVRGETGSIIDFKIKFNGTCGKDKNRYAIIRVEYHNYTCYHLIFVRQGDAPDDLFDGTGTKWHAYNLRTKRKETDSPLEEGSLFKFNKLDYPIDAMSNKNSYTPWINVTPDSFENDASSLWKATDNTENKTEMAWDEIEPFPLSPWGYNPVESTIDGLEVANARVATYEDFYALYAGENLAEGYGVLYGNESTETLDDITKVYGYDYEHTNCGMRGCFIYNKENGKNLFFPIGASGYGHRKATDRNGAHDKGNGVLRYASLQNTYFSAESVGNSPLFYDLYMRPGAVYWLGQYRANLKLPDEDHQRVIGWDFNYFTFDFYPYGVASAQNGKDACFIRCVEKK
ncbi:MAG: hypothetical protein K2I15_05765 [Bacteroides sp.]|nr:hypothetical protein [Bacteroides sp.]